METNNNGAKETSCKALHWDASELDHPTCASGLQVSDPELLYVMAVTLLFQWKLDNPS